MIYSRWGSRVELRRPVTTEAEVESLEMRKADKHDRERLKYGMYAIATFFHEDGSDAGDRMVDLAMLRADDGSREINQAARKVGCDPK